MKDNLFGVIASREAVYFRRLFFALPNPNLLFATAGSRTASLQNVSDDPHVAACIQSRKAGVLTMTWELEVDESNKAYLEFIKKVFSGFDLLDVITSILDAPLYGYQPFEIYWQEELIDGKIYIIPKDIVAKPPDWFFYDESNLLRLRTVTNPYPGVLLDSRKFVVANNLPSYENPYGEAVLSKCLWPLVFKKGGQTFWIKFVEKYGMPHFVGKTDALRGQEDYEDFQAVLDDLIQDASAVISSTESIDVLNGAAPSSTVIFKDLMDFCNAEISKAILSQTLTTEVGTGGNYATGRVHADVRHEVIQADKRLVEKIINTVIKWVIDINFGSNIKPPRFEMFREEDLDVTMSEVAQNLQRNRTVMFLAPFYKKRFNFDEDEFKVIELNLTSPVSGAITTPDTSFADENNDSTPDHPDQILIDAFGDRGIKEGSNVFIGLSHIIKSFLEKQSDFKTAINQLSGLLPDMDTSELESKLTSIMFMSDVIGRLSVQKETENG